MPVEGHIIDYEVRRDASRQIKGRSSIRFLYYEDIEANVEPVYEEQSVRGRSEEHVFYSHTSGEVNSFSIRLPASVDESDNRTPQQTWKEYLFIKSFAYPDYGESFKGPILPPRKAIITIGKWYRKVGVIKSPSATFSKVCDEDGYPLIIDVRFQFRIINSRPLSLRDIRAQT
jgi:hypothetical protein